jgi:glycosyltransferase involved in cell wall biosynthesis
MSLWCNDSAMKILLAIYSAGLGGVETATQELVAGLREIGHEVTVLNLTDGQVRSNVAIDVDHTLEFMWYKPRSVSQAVIFFKRFFAIRRYVSSRGPDVVIGIKTPAFSSLAISTFGKGVPLVACEHRRSEDWPWTGSVLNKIRTAILKFAIRNSNGIVALTPDLSRHYEREFGVSSRVIKNPIKKELFLVPEHSPFQLRALSIGYLGRFSEEKRILELTQAWKSFTSSSNTEWSLWIMGDGPQFEDIREICYASEQMRLISPLDLSVEDFFSNVRIVFLVSAFELQPLVAVEAIVSGCVLVISREVSERCPWLVQAGAIQIDFLPTVLNQVFESLDQLATNSSGLHMFADQHPKVVARAWSNYLLEIVESG